MISDHFAHKCLVAITIIDKLNIVLSDNDNDKNLSIDNYRSIIIADNAHHCIGGNYMLRHIAWARHKERPN